MRYYLKFRTNNHASTHFLGFGSGSVWGPFGVRSGSVRGPFGVRSGSVWANFGPNFSDPKILKFQKFSICAAVAAAAGAL